MTKQRLQVDQTTEVHQNPRTQEETTIATEVETQAIDEDGCVLKDVTKTTEFYACGHSRKLEGGYCLMDGLEHCIECLTQCDVCGITICKPCSSTEEDEKEILVCDECDRPFQATRRIGQLGFIALVLTAITILAFHLISKRRMKNVTEHTPQYIRNYEFAQEHNLLHGPFEKAIHQCLGNGVRNKILEEQLDKLIIDVQLFKAKTSPFPPQPPTSGNFIAGFDLFQNIPRRCDLQQLNSNFGFFSRTGGGKSTALMWWILQIAKEMPHLIVECKKSGLGNHLKPLYDRLGIELEIIEEGCWNPLEPETGVSLRSHGIAISEAIGLALGSELPSQRVLMKAIFRLYDLMKEGIIKPYPTLYHLRKLLASSKITKMIKDSLIGRLDRVLLSTDSFRYSQGWKTEDLCKKRILLNLSKYPDEVQDMKINILLTKEFTRRINNEVYNPQMDYFITFDDSQRLTKGNTAISKYSGLTRGTGIGLGVFQQGTSETDNNVLENLGNIFIGPVTDSRTLKYLCDSVGLLSYNQVKWLSNHLTPGVALCSIKDVHFPSLIKIPNLVEVEVRDYFNYLTEGSNGHLQK